MKKEKEQMMRKLKNLMVVNQSLFSLPRLLLLYMMMFVLMAEQLFRTVTRLKNAVLADSPLPNSKVVYLPAMSEKSHFISTFLAVKARVKAAICSLLDAAVVRIDSSSSRSGFRCVA